MACSMLAMVLAASAATAQETPSTTTPIPDTAEKARDGEPVQLDGVVVTARRRDEVVQDVPMAVTALSGAELESRGAEDLTALGAATPNLTIYPARSFNSTLTAYIRGVGQSDPAWGYEPGVAVYVDDVYLARPQAALLDILDVERIEVLRGPQGTLYGKNTIGGAIKYVTRMVGDDFSGNVGATFGSYGRRDFKAVVNVPLTQEFRVRVAFGTFNRDGFGTNLATGEDVSAKDARVARVTAEWLASEDVDVRLAYDRYRDRSGMHGARRLAINPADPLHTPPNDNDFDVQSGMANIDDADSENASVTVDWHPDARWRLKSITAHHSADTLGNVDFDTLPLAISDVARHIFDQQTSQELQLHLDSGRSHAVGGLYFFDGTASGRVNVINNNRMFVRSTGSIGTRSAAIYGDLTVDLDDRLSLEAGLRYTSETKTGMAFNQGYTDGTFTTPNGLVAADFTDSKTFNAWSPRLNLSWRQNEDVLLYVQASRGFKSGSYNIRANTRFVPGSDRPYADETATTYELGAKTQWLDGRLTLNATAFHNDYRDLQLNVFVNIDTDGDGIADAPFGDFRNAGAATIDGAELELAAQTGAHLRWLGNVGYLHAKYDEYLSAGVNIADSQHLVNAPRLTGGFSAIADLPLGAAGSLVARVDGHYQSKVYSSPELVSALAEATAQDGYTLWNASLIYQPPRQQWQLALHGQNLGDKSYRTSGNSDPLIGYYGPPRTTWLSLTWFF